MTNDTLGGPMETGLFILRLVIGALLVGHGTQKLFGWFGGHGIAGTGAFFDSIGFRPARPMAVVAGVSEAGAGLLLALGLLTPLAAAAIIGTLVVASSVHWTAGLWGQNGGYELPLVYAVVAAALGFTGPGAYSLDDVLGLADLTGVAVGLAAAVIGLVAGLAVVARARRPLRTDASDGSAQTPGREAVAA